MDYFEYLKNKENITFYEALEVLVPLFVKVHKWNVGDDVNKIRSAKYDLLKSLFEQIVEKKYVEGEVVRDYEYDIDGNIIFNGYDAPEQVTYLGQSTMKSSMLFRYVEGYLKHFKYAIPYELLILNGKLTKENIGANGDNIEQEGEVLSADFEAKYPKFDDLDINNPSKEKLQALKKKYGELRDDASKSKAAIPIATQVCQQFYEMASAGQVTEKAFVEEFAKKCSVVSKKTVSMMYKSLVSDIKSKGGSPIKEPSGIDDDMVDTVINATALTGYLSCKEGSEFLADLEERLGEDGYDIPPDTYLKAITGACKRVIKKYKDM